MQETIKENQAKFEYQYLIKVFGKFDEKKLLGIRKGAIIKGQKLGPFFVS